MKQVTTPTTAAQKALLDDDIYEFKWKTVWTEFVLCGLAFYDADNYLVLRVIFVGIFFYIYHQRKDGQAQAAGSSATRLVDDDTICHVHGVYYLQVILAVCMVCCVEAKKTLKIYAEYDPELLPEAIF